MIRLVPRGNMAVRSTAMRRFFAFLGGAALFCVSAGYLPAQVEVEAYLWQDRAYLGEGFIYQIQVVGGAQVGKPDLSGFGQFSVREVRRQWINPEPNQGPERIDRGTNHFYRLVAVKSGTLTVPAASIEVDGRTYRTKPKRIVIEPAPPSDEFRLQLTLEKTRVYQGEPLVFRATWYFRSEGNFYYAYIPILQSDAFDSMERSGSYRGSMRIRTPGGSNALSGELGSATLDGLRFRTMTFEYVLLPITAGNYTFAPASIQVWRQTSATSRSNNRRAGYEQTIINSNPLQVTVRPLPSQGRPHDFTGIVGSDIALDATISHLEMNVGDPVTLTVEISGLGIQPTTQIPPLRAQAALTDRFAIGPAEPTSRLTENGRAFSQTVRVKREDVTEVPELSIPYFNPKNETYEHAVAAAIPITVRPTQIVTAEDLEGDGTFPGLERTTIRDFDQGIRFNYGAGPALLQDSVTGFISPRSETPLVWLLPLPLLAVLAALLYRFTTFHVSGNHAETGLAVGSDLRYSTQDSPQKDGSAGTALALGARGRALHAVKEHLSTLAFTDNASLLILLDSVAVYVDLSASRIPHNRALSSMAREFLTLRGKLRYGGPYSESAPDYDAVASQIEEFVRRVEDAG